MCIHYGQLVDEFSDLFKDLNSLKQRSGQSPSCAGEISLVCCISLAGDRLHMQQGPLRSHPDFCTIVFNVGDDLEGN